MADQAGFSHKRSGRGDILLSAFKNLSHHDSNASKESTTSRPPATSRERNTHEHPSGSVTPRIPHHRGMRAELVKSAISPCIKNMASRRKSEPSAAPVLCTPRGKPDDEKKQTQNNDSLAKKGGKPLHTSHKNRGQLLMAAFSNLGSETDRTSEREREQAAVLQITASECALQGSAAAECHLRSSSLDHKEWRGVFIVLHTLLAPPSPSPPPPSCPLGPHLFVFSSDQDSSAHFALPLLGGRVEQRDGPLGMELGVCFGEDGGAGRIGREEEGEAEGEREGAQGEAVLALRFAAASETEAWKLWLLKAASAAAPAAAVPGLRLAQAGRGNICV